MIEEVTEITKNPFFKKIIYKDNDIVVGFIEFNHLYEHLDIINIEVKEEYRNKKIGSRLMEALINYGHKNNCSNITLEVNEKNIIAKKLYLKYNFKQVALRKNYYKDSDGILMELIL